MAYQNTNIFLGDSFIPKLYLGENEIDVSPINLNPPVYVIRTDPYASYISYAAPMNYFSASFDMTAYNSDIHASVKGSGTNFVFPTTGSGIVTASADYNHWASDGYVTSMNVGNYVNGGAYGNPVPTELNMGSGDFVYECYVNPTQSVPSNSMLLMWGYPNFASCAIFSNGGIPTMRVYADGVTNDGVLTMTPGTWYHWAMSRSGNNYRGYFNGNLIVTLNSSVGLSTNSPTQILGISTDANPPMYVQDYRIYKGTDKGYTGSTITPPPSIVTYY
jgi:hypothetical protein